MANDRDPLDGREFRDEDEQDGADATKRGKDRSGDRDRVIGEGMHSLDSTQAPLKSETGEPDWDAMDEETRRRLQEDE